MVAFSSYPWTAERIARGFVHILSNDSPREVVALVDGGEHAAANAALIRSAPLMASAILADNIIAARAALADAGLT